MELAWGSPLSGESDREQAVDSAAVAGDSATLTCGATKEGKARGKNWGVNGCQLLKENFMGLPHVGKR